jgi:hypothetical protein
MDPSPWTAAHVVVSLDIRRFERVFDRVSQAARPGTRL